ncbi:Hypothetical predicted protein [Cloeon dipterum]|uniref:CHK kinase-like domain-containing protein n=1 Tax=Cloeon dipterum TaxID=197152 RepID=A0A8S1CNV3_9INSE|nr:Hypothetical predicted protein [Cloeon dipterum]
MATEINKPLVSFEEAAGVVENIHGAAARLLEHKVEKGTDSVQGFLSNILRVSVRVEVGGKSVESKFMVKRQPVLESQQRLIQENGVFYHEIGVFQRCFPILLRNSPDLPAVACYSCDARDNVIFMEDLKEDGFNTVVRNICDLKGDILDLKHLTAAMLALAKFHGASVGTDWLKKFPDLFEKEIFLEQAFIKAGVANTARSVLVPIAEHHFKDERHVKAAEWIGTEEFYETLLAITKPDPEVPNVLCHGDCWVNNMMFKTDWDSGRVSAKLIDFQMSRFAPGSRDLLYFLHMCCSPQVRQRCEEGLLRTYWTAFNAECEKRGLELSWDRFYADYDQNRAFGLMMLATLRPWFFLDGPFSQKDDELTDEQMDKMTSGGKSSAAPTSPVEEFETNQLFRDEMIGTLEEVAEIYYKFYARNE